ncbi:MAG: Hsp20 family protein, partial [Desulfobacterales bacterium]
QLISLARAVLAKPELFIMDEATSSVDTLTESLIQQGMETLMKNTTSFIIAHRLSTIKKANRILVIEDGQIAEIGSHRSFRIPGKIDTENIEATYKDGILRVSLVKSEESVIKKIEIH